MPDVEDGVMFDRNSPEGKIFPVVKISNGPFNSSPYLKDRMARANSKKQFIS